MKPSPANTTVRLIETDKFEPVAIELFGLKTKKLEKGKEPPKYTIKTNGHDQLAVVEDGVVICHLLGQDDTDVDHIMKANGTITVENRKGSDGLCKVFVIATPIPGKKPVFVEAVGEKVAVAAEVNEFALGAKA